MSQTKVLAVLAGAALGFGAAAMGQTADAGRSYQNELLADSADRVSLLGRSNGTGLHVGGMTQIQFKINGRDDVADPDEDMTTGFSNRRTQLWFEADVNEEWSVRINGGFMYDGGGFNLEDAFARYQANENTDVQIGQFRLPFLREENVADHHQLAGDRSPMHSVFGQGRSQGVQVRHVADDFRVFFAFSDGVQTANTEFNSMAEADWAFTARGEFKWEGEWSRFDDFTSFQNSDNAGMVGGAVHYQSGGSTGGPTSDVDVLGLTVDAAMEGNGWNAYAAVVWVSSDPDVGEERDDLGFLIQGGWFMNAVWEVFGRFDAVIPDGDNEEDFYTITAGVNHYLIENSHAAKVTVDLQWFLDAQGESIVPANPAAGLLASGEDSQWALRGQLQLVVP